MRRDDRLILDRVDWQVHDDERWVLLGRNGSGKTTLIRIASLYLHPSSGTVRVLGETLGRTDVRRLRTRIGLASPSLADQLRADLTPVEIVMTARHAAARTVVAHLRRRRPATGPGAARRHGLRRAGRPALRSAVLRRAPAGAAGPHAHERTRTAAARRAHRRARSRWPRGARRQPVRRSPATSSTPATVLVTHHVEEIPQGFTHVLLMAGGRVVGRGPLDETLTAGALSDCFGLRLVLEHRDGRWSARAAPT